MKLISLLSLLLLPVASLAEPHEDVKASPSCTYCGMDRAKFASSRMVIVYEDGTRTGTCSIHCAAIDLAVALGKTPAAFQVGDMATKELIDAEKATWVLGGSKPGVMTGRGKWAFAERAAAEAFVKQHGGTLATFEEALKAAFDDMYQDLKMLRENRKKMLRRKALEKETGHAP